MEHNDQRNERRQEREARRVKQRELMSKGYRPTTFYLKREIITLWELVAQRRGQSVEQLLIEGTDRLLGIKPYEDIAELNRAKYQELFHELYHDICQGLKTDLNVDVIAETDLAEEV
jgi:hypothetical protein